MLALFFSACDYAVLLHHFIIVYYILPLQLAYIVFFECY
jgi:hypothetical protein